MECRPWILTDVEVLEGQPALGKGAYGIVYDARWKGIEVAAKRVHDTLAVHTKGTTNIAMQGIEDEGETMQQLRHPHLVQFLGVYYDDLKRLHLVMEKMEESLADLLERSKGPLDEMKIYSIGTDVTSALRYMHELPTPIAHRDLTPKNILLSADLRAKVSDLGACKQALKLHAPMNATLAPGNPKYMPPEALDGGRFATYAPTGVDVFSMGIVLLEMFSGTDPEPSSYGAFLQCPSDPTKFYRVREEERRSECFKKIAWNHPLSQLISDCVHGDQRHRPTMREIQDVLLDLKDRHVMRNRSNATYYREKAQRLASLDMVDDGVSPPELHHPYVNVPSTRRNSRRRLPPALPPKGSRRSWHSAEEPVSQYEAMTDRAPQRPMNKRMPPRQSSQSYESLHFDHDIENLKGNEGQGLKKEEHQRSRYGHEDEIYDDYLVMAHNEANEEQGRDHTRLMRLGSSPSMVSLEKTKPKGQMMRRLTEEDNLSPEERPLPSLPSPPKTDSQDSVEDPPLYDSIEDVETVLKVTEPFRKRQTKAFIVLKNGHKRGALSATQNELLVSLGRVADQSEMVHARNSEGKTGLIADTQVQLVKPVTFNHSSDSSPGIIQHLTYKAGPKVKAIQISSSKIAKGNLETLTSLANTDIVAVDRPSNSGSAFFQIDFFKHRMVRVEGYILQWARVIGRFGYPLQWVVAVSPDGKAWIEVGREVQPTTTKTSQYWPVRQKSLGRYLRISLLGANSEGNNMLCLNGIELYGDLYSSVDDQYMYI